ncbi:initiation factor 2 [Stipitochalara longipes BDJ]|nr:initiation factor 2 [Stipitochalara longipes BDJ]
MRGRSLLKETSSPSLCAFCAHRLGQARKPSHVQRRFLQSSRPVARPPAEATAVLESDNERGQAPGWGRPGSVGGNELSPTVSWGRPFGNGAIPSAPAGPLSGWGRPNTGTNGIPAGSVQFNPLPAVDDLLPHERKAREMMLEQEVKSQSQSQQRPLGNRVLGHGPEATRAGRPPLRTTAERQEITDKMLARRKAMETNEILKASGQAGSSQAGPKIRKLATNHVMGDPSGDKGWRAPYNSNNNTHTSGWEMLRRRRDQEPLVEDRRQPEHGINADQARREEQARTMAYTPLNSRSMLGNNTGKTRYGERRSVGSRMEEDQTGMRSAWMPLERDQFGHRNPASNRTPWPPEKPAFAPISKPTEDDRTFVRFSPLAPAPENQSAKADPPSSKTQVFNQEEEHRPARERKEKKARARYSEQPTYESAPRGKDKDKARRRERFVQNEEAEAALEEAEARAEAKRQRKREKAAKKAAAPTPMLLPEYISVSNLAVALKVRLEDFISKMEELGFEETSHDHILNAENAGLIAMEYNFEPIIDRSESEDLRAREPPADPSTLPQRPPVVTIMGHVDHGKTTLLDWLRKSSVAASEHGGITQHIGAFSVPMPSGKIITFLDTPGHAAFLSMRQRGANVTDIVILVVAADDSVKPQTIEAINHAKAAKVPIIVAINKVDKEEANVDRVKQDLARHGVDVEDFGGDVQAICVSGKTGQGMGELEEAAVTLSEILDMRAETDGQAEGWVLEASIKSMGKVATVLVRRGTMRPGDFIVAGKTWARIRCLRNEAGVEIHEAGPGTPVEIDGWREQPLAGDEVLQAPDESKAKSVVQYRLEKGERDKMAEDMEAINENRKAEQERRDREKAEALAAAEAKRLADEGIEVGQDTKDTKDTKPSGPKEVFFIVKGDVSGSVEAVIDSIAALGNKEVQPHILRSGVGQLSEFDIEHAAAAQGHLINFNTAVEPNISRLAEEAKVKIIDHNIIYRLVDDVKAELSKHLPPLVTQRVLGEAEIAQIFSINIKGRQHKNIAGCKVRNGSIAKTAKVRVLRRGEKVFDGSLASLKNVKKDVQEMKKGSECGLGFEDWFDFQTGDQVQCYEEKVEKRYL